MAFLDLMLAHLLGKRNEEEHDTEVPPAAIMAMGSVSSRNVGAITVKCILSGAIDSR